MIISVLQWSWDEGKVRKVEIPDAEYAAEKTDEHKLEKVFYYGQNDFQPRQCPSVSVGDVAVLGGAFWLCDNFGWKKLDDEKYEKWINTSGRDRRMGYRFVSQKIWK